MDWLKELFVPDIKLVIALTGLLTAYFQWRKSQNEIRGFKQQLISLLHHAEGVASSVRQVVYNAREGKYSTVEDMAAGVESTAMNADALFFGLVETKVGGSALKEDLDKKYSEWADLELERKKLPLKDFIYQQKLKTSKVSITSIETERRKRDEWVKAIANLAGKPSS